MGFDLNTIYTKIISKKELIKIIKRCYDKEFIVTFLPRKSDNADIIIRSTEEYLSNNKKAEKEVKKK